MQKMEMEKLGCCLMLYDTELIRFSVLQNLADPVLQIDWINEDSRELFPLGMEPNAKGLARWLRHRTIPKNRAFANSFLAKCGLSPNRPMDIISMCKGLSLNDAYWVKEEGSQKSFDEVNLYDNRFSRILGELAFTGFGSSFRSSIVSSPEFTTNGMLPKCWRRSKGTIELYKGATSGFSNTGNEPYSEIYAAQIGARLGFNVIPYRISMWKVTFEPESTEQTEVEEDHIHDYARMTAEDGTVSYVCECGAQMSEEECNCIAVQTTAQPGMNTGVIRS